MNPRLLPIFLALCLSLSAAGRDIYDIRTFGAAGDGKTLDSPAINAAIEACSSAGGGQASGKPYPELGTGYPEPRHLGPTPSYGLFARHVDGLCLRNVAFELMTPDSRSPILLEDVEGYRRV